MKKHLFIRGIILVFCMIVITPIPTRSSGVEETELILVYCGVGMSKPLDEIGRMIQEKNNVVVRYNYAGSNTLIRQMELIREGAAFMPGALMYNEIAEEKGLVSYSQLICYHLSVITVPKGILQELPASKTWKTRHQISME